MATAKTVKDTTVTLFEKFWNMTKEVAKEMKKPLIERSLRRKLASAADSCDDTIIDVETKISKLHEDLENLDINEMLKLRVQKSNAIKTKAEIESYYEELFSEKLVA